MEIKNKIIQNVNGLDISILESGNINKNKNNVILFLHGFPELSYSYRYLLKFFSKAGYYCVAPDQRGYGNTKLTKAKRDIVSNYSITNLTKDLYSLINKFQIKKINIVGHDFGSYVAGYFAIFYPDRVKSIVMMSMPFSGTFSKNSQFDLRKINTNLRLLKPPKKHYQIYFSGRTANKNMMNCQQGLSSFLKGYYYFKSYSYKNNKPKILKDTSPLELCKMPEYYIMKRNLGIAETVANCMPNLAYIQECSWLSKKDLKVYVDSFKKNSFQKPLYWYKMMLDVKENMFLKSLKLPKLLKIPALFIAGQADWGTYQKPGQLEDMKKFFYNLYDIVIITKAGHWVQQEQPYKSFKAINNFYKKTK